MTVYATNPANTLPWREIVNGVRIQRFKRFAPSGSYFFSADMILSLRKASFDVVHGHSYNSLPMHFSFLATHKKLIFTTHFHSAGHSVFRNCLFSLFKPVGKMTLLQADKIIAVSEFEKRLLSKYFNLDRERIVVIPNGLDLKEFAGIKRCRRPDRKTILYVGRLEAYKGPQTLIEALPLLDKNIVLEVVGKGPLRKTLENQANNLGVQNRVLFFQDLSRHELLQKYVDADLFVLLSLQEAYSLVVAEALVAGTPCIVTNTTALTEWIDNNTCFGIDTPVRASRLATLVNSIIDADLNGKPVFQERIGTKIPDWNSVTQQLEKVYQE